jgi:hypothetical protein
MGRVRSAKSRQKKLADFFHVSAGLFVQIEFCRVSQQLLKCSVRKALQIPLCAPRPHGRDR